MNTLTYLSQNITFYCPIIIITIGNIGCICNFITFTSRKLSKSSCSRYFLYAAIFDFLTLNFGGITKLLGDHFEYSAENHSQFFCKIRLYFINFFPGSATCLIVLAAMDRLMSTSTQVAYRSLATVAKVKWITAFSLFICSLSYIHYPLFADLRPLCTLQSGAYIVFTIIFAIGWSTLVPHILMLCFGLITQHHIRKTRRQVIPTSTRQRRTIRQEYQLITVRSLKFTSIPLN